MKNKRNMEKMLLLGGGSLYTCFFTYFFTGLMFLSSNINSLEVKANQKADVNKNGQIELVEAINAYKSIGHTNEQIVRNTRWAAYRNEPIKYLDIKSSDVIGAHKNLFLCLVFPFTAHKGSGLERYVNGK